jgi:hypothetical protein
MKTQENVVTEIDVKTAVQRAKEFAATLFEPERISRIGLEAVERTEDGEYWLVTLGFIRPALYEPRTYSPLDQVLPRPEPREYKVFRVDAHTGEVVSVDVFKQ